MFAFTHPLKNIFPRRGRIRVQRYKNILNYANENAKNVRNIHEKIQILTEIRNKGGKPAAKQPSINLHIVEFQKKLYLCSRLQILPITEAKRIDNNSTTARSNSTIWL